MEVDSLINRIVATPLFIQSQSIIENIDGFHDHESVYDHSLKTADIAKRQVNGTFITDNQAKKVFNKFLNQKVGNLLRKECLILIALLHDCGKVLLYEEDGKHYPMLTNRPDSLTQTMLPGHEHWGGTLVATQLLKDLPITKKTQEYIAMVVGLHDTFNTASYFTTKKDWPVNGILLDLKARAQGYYIEALFNTYCDCYTAGPFEEAKPIIEKIFNTKELYLPRRYVLPNITGK